MFRDRGIATGPARSVGGLELEGIVKTYGAGDAAVTALAGVTLSVPAGSFVAVMGQSGSGKSTLLQCAAGLQEPDTGEVRIGGRRLDAAEEDAAAAWRRREIGFVFQHYNLVPFLTAEENVALPLRAAGIRVGAGRIHEAITEVGIAGRGGHRPAELSGGEQQRVAIARALVTAPTVLFADEPTGALDSAAAARVLALLRAARDRHGQTVVMVTHDPVAAGYADCVVFMSDGRLAGELEHPEPRQVAERLAQLATGSGAGRRALEVIA